MRRCLLAFLLALPVFGQPPAPKVPVREKPFIADLRARARRGQAEAQFQLGVCYRFGQGVSKDEAEALKWYLKAAAQGHEKAQYNVGVCYDAGTGVAQDHEEAARWYRKAAQRGHAKAAYNLAVDYKYGQGVARDDAEAFAWFDFAASRGEAVAAAARDELAEGMDPGTRQRAGERAMVLKAVIKPVPAPVGKKGRKAP